MFGVYSDVDNAYAVEAKVLSMYVGDCLHRSCPLRLNHLLYLLSWGGLFATFQVLGQFTGGECNDRFGRRLTLYSIVFWTLVGVMLEVIATTWQMWLGSKVSP